MALQDSETLDLLLSHPSLKIMKEFSHTIILWKDKICSGLSRQDFCHSSKISHLHDDCRAMLELLTDFFD